MRREQFESDREADGSASTRGDDDRSTTSTSSGRTGAVAALQRTVGNRAVQQLQENGEIEPGSAVSQPDDRLEREAERTADRILRKPVSESDAGRSDTIESETTAKTSSPGNAENSQSRGATKAGGEPLSSTVRSSFESRFGSTLQDVRIHTGVEADRAARSLNARALTVGSDIVFRRGEYNPETTAGRRLLAHELAHVQQDVGGIQRQTQSPVDAAQSTVGESEAEAQQQAHEEAASQSAETEATQGGEVAEEVAAAQLDTGTAITGADETFYRIDASYEDVPDNWEHTIDGKSVASITQFEVHPQISQFDSQNPMTVDWSFSTLEVSLPRWTRFETETAPIPERLEWARFMRCLRIHEQTHVDICNEYINNIPSERQTIQAQNRQAAHQQLATYRDQAVQEIEDRFEEYDNRTNHGETQGATLRPPAELERQEDE